MARPYPPGMDASSLDDTAAGCPALRQARALAAWVGEQGRAVTASGVLRRADVAAATAALGQPHSGLVRSAADLPALHRPWTAARGAGYLIVSPDGVRAATPSAPPLQCWLGALRAVLRAESGDVRRSGAALMCEIVLDLPLTAEREQTIEDAVDALPREDAVAAWDAFRGGAFPEVAAAEVLSWFGAVDGIVATPLGRWARGRLDGPDPFLADAPRSAPAVTAMQLQIRLDRVRPPVWRRVVLDSRTTLGELHGIIQAAFDWDDDHLHVFTVDGHHYTDPCIELVDCADESLVEIAAALPRPTTSLRYRYDLGDCWDHTVTFEKVLDLGAAGPLPVCTGGRGAAPIEDWTPDDEQEAPAFDRDRITRAMARTPARR